jgi:RNA polymerase sigma factor (sigma-70 family)
MKTNPNREPLAPTELAPTRASLLARLKDLGNDQSWQEFFDTYHRLIYGRLINSGLSPQDADEVVMEIVEGIARRMPTFVYEPRRCSFKTWLFRVVQYRLADHFRRRARSLARMQPVTDGMELLEEMADPAASEPDRKWEEEWERNLFQAALERVRRRANPRSLQIFIYSELEGHSVPETADHLSTTPEGVSLAKHRIKEMLRTEVERLRRQSEARLTGKG